MSKYLVAGISAGILWAFMVIPLRELHSYSSFIILLSRILLSCFLLVVFVLTFKGELLQSNKTKFLSLSTSDRKKTILFLVLSGLMLALNWFSFIYIVTKINIKSGSLVYMVCPIITAFGGIFVFKDHLNKFKIAALTLVIISFSILAFDHLHDVLYIIFCASCYATFIMIQKKIQQFERLIVFTIQVSIVFFLSLPFIIYEYQSGEFPIELHFWIHLLIIAILFTIIPMLINLYALSGLSVSTGGIVIYSNPIFTFLIGIIFYEEQIKNIEVLCYSIIVIAVLLFNWNIIRPQKTAFS